MKNSYLPLLVVLVCAVLMSCSSEKPAAPAGGSSSVDQILKGSTPTGKTFKSADGSCEITVPDNWSEEKDLNKDAKIQAANRIRDVYMVVFVDQKDKYGSITLEEFAEGAHKKLVKRLTSPVGNPGDQLTVGGLPAVQYEVSGAAGGSTYTYHQTLVEGSINFYEILTWTSKAQLDKNQYMIHEAIKSFKESAAAPAAATN